jgi:hypothetical protein
VHAATPPGEKLVPSGQTVQAELEAAAAEPGPHIEHVVSRVLVQADAGA